MVYVTDYEWKEPKEVSNEDFDRVRIFNGWTEEEVYSQINNYAKLHNLRLVNSPKIEYNRLMCGSTYVITAVFDRM